MAQFPQLNFKEVAENLIESSPELWSRHKAYLALVQRDVKYHVEQKFAVPQKIEFLQKKLEECYGQLNRLDIKYGILPFFNGEMQTLIDGIIGMLDIAKVQNPDQPEVFEKLEKLYSEDLDGYLESSLAGQFDIDKFKSLKEDFDAIKPPGFSEIPELNWINDVVKMNQEQLVNFSIDKILNIYSIQIHIEWLTRLIDDVKDGDKHQDNINYQTYNEILEPIETEENPMAFVKALEFFCSTKKGDGKLFLSKDDVEKLKEIGHRLPKDGVQSPMTFKLDLLRTDKEIFYGFFYIAWSKFFPKNRGKNNYALYIKTYFDDFKDLGIESIQSAIKMPSMVKKAKIDPFFDASFQKN